MGGASIGVDHGPVGGISGPAGRLPEPLDKRQDTADFELYGVVWGEARGRYVGTSERRGMGQVDHHHDSGIADVGVAELGGGSLFGNGQSGARSGV